MSPRVTSTRRQFLQSTKPWLPYKKCQSTAEPQSTSSLQSVKTPSMYLVVTRAPCKNVPALLPPSQTSPKPETMDKKPYFWNFKWTWQRLVQFSLPFLYLYLALLLVPQACVSRCLCQPLDLSTNPYRRLMSQKEMSCTFSCFVTNGFIVSTPSIVFILLGLLYLNTRRKKAAIMQIIARREEEEIV